MVPQYGIKSSEQGCGLSLGLFTSILIPLLFGYIVDVTSLLPKLGCDHALALATVMQEEVICAIHY